MSEFSSSNKRQMDVYHVSNEEFNMYVHLRLAFLKIFQNDEWYNYNEIAEQLIASKGDLL